MAHARARVHGVYKRWHLLAQRLELMQAWADHLDVLKPGDSGVVIKEKSAA